MKTYSLAKVIRHLAATNGGYIAGYVILGILIPICWVFSPYTFSMLIDQKKIFSIYVVIPVALFLLGYAFEYCCDALDYYFTEKINYTVAAWSTERLFTSFRRRFANSKMTESINTINKLSQTCTFAFRDGRIFVMGLIFAAIIGTSFLWWIHKSLGIFLLVGVIALLLLVALFMYRSVKLTAKTDQTRDHLLEQISDTLINMPSVFAGNQVDNEMHRVQNGYKDLENTNKSAERQVQTVRIGINLFYLFIVAGLFLISAFLYRKGELSAGILATVVMVTMYMIYNFDELSINSGNLIRNIGQMLQAQTFLNELKEKEEANPDGTSVEPPADGGIVLDKLTVVVGDNVVLHDLTLNIAPGEVILLTGRNGSGKSTLLKTIFGGLPYTGSMLFGGYEIRDMQAAVLRSNITYVPQVPHLFHRTVYENISYGNGATRDEVVLLLDKFGVDFVGLDDIIGNSHLSGGQQQLIYLLRAYLQKNSKLILLDEPTSALDTHTRDKAMRLLSTLMADRTAIIVTHDSDLSQYSTREIKLGDVLE